MNYKKFGNLEFKASALGFGAMRLPLSNKGGLEVDEKEAIAMIRYAFDNGVNYVDTAYPYHSGQSEVVVGKALKDGYREKVKLADKLPCRLINSKQDLDKYLKEQILRLGEEHIDFYLLHGLNKERWEEIKKFDIFRWLEEKKKQGLIGEPGFSFHDELPLFKEIVDSFGWTFCQIQYNFMDTNFQAGSEGLKYAADKGLAVVVMEPLKGGKLAVEPPLSVKKVWESAPFKRSPVEWALRWVWSHPEVSLLLSGMSNMEQVKENIRFASKNDYNVLSEQGKEIVLRAKEEYENLSAIPCSECRYCLPCPQGIDIPRIFKIYNERNMFSDLEGARNAYKRATSENGISACADCGVCEAKCPQALKIRDWLKRVDKVLNT